MLLTPWCFFIINNWENITMKYNAFILNFKVRSDRVESLHLLLIRNWARTGREVKL